RSSFSLRRRVSSLPTSSCGPSSKSLCSCSERHRLNVDLAMPRSFATRSTLRPLVSVSRTASRLNSFVNRLCLFLLIATSAIFHRGWLSTFAGQVHAGHGPSPARRFPSTTRKPSTRKEADRGLLSVVLGAEMRKGPERRSMPGTRQLLRFAAGSKKYLAHGNAPMGSLTCASLVWPRQAC